MITESDTHYLIDKNDVQLDQLQKFLQKCSKPVIKFSLGLVSDVIQNHEYKVTDGLGNVREFDKISAISNEYSIPNSNVFRLIEGYKVRGVDISIERIEDVYIFKYDGVEYKGNTLKKLSENSNISMNNIYKIFKRDT